MDHIGIDVHKRESQICVLRDTGELEERRIRTTRDRFAAVLGGRKPAQVLVEAGTESEWVAQCLEGLGHRVIVADPNYAPMYPRVGRRQKTDRRDAVALAEASAKGTYRPVHRVSAGQRQVRQQLVVREALVRTRTRLIAIACALIRGEGLRVRPGHAEGFLARLAEVAVSPTVTAVLAPLRTTLAQVEAALAVADRALTAQVAADPVVQRFQTVPGVGVITSAAVRATLDTPDRFAGPRQATSYLGLVPCARSSGDTRRSGRITKAGPGRARWLLVQAAWTILRSTSARAAPLRRWAEQVARRRGPAVAVVALARRLAVILYAMWRDGTVFAPERLGRSHAAA